MSVVDVPMPKLSDSMEEATVLRWLRRPGEAVTRGEPLVEVETDKATVVYEAESDGVLAEIVVDEGSTAELGAVIARLRIGDGGPAPIRRVDPARTKPARARATPVARRLAEQLGVPLADVAGTGPGGRVVRADVNEAARGNAPAQQRRAGSGSGSGRGAVVEVPHTATQRTIAQRMSASRSTVPEFTLQAEVAMSAAVRLRDDLRAGGVEPLPSFNDLVVRAVALALRQFPALNACYAPGKTLRYERINVGVAVAADDALLVPTVRDADTLSILELARETRRLAERARTRSLTAAELADGTFTVSNLGMLGVRRFDAVINQDEAAILAVGEVAERPVVEDGAVVARPAMEVSLSCDHRVVYGAEAARFLRRLRELLEHPALLTIESKGAR